MITVSPKFPGLSAFLVLGLSIGACLNKDYANALFALLVFAVDCMRFERATQAAKQGEKP